LLRQRQFEVGSQNLVIAVDAIVANRHCEELLALQGLEDLRAPGPIEHLVAQRASQSP
jgi:hypothetical protein